MKGLKESLAPGPSPGMWVLSPGVAPGWVWLGLVLWDEGVGAPDSWWGAIMDMCFLFFFF